jgi:hypothetical protein
VDRSERCRKLSLGMTRTKEVLNDKGEEEEEMHAIHFIEQTTMQELTRICVRIHNTRSINMPWFVL